MPEREDQIGDEQQRAEQQQVAAISEAERPPAVPEEPEQEAENKRKARNQIEGRQLLRAEAQVVLEKILDRQVRHPDRRGEVAGDEERGEVDADPDLCLPGAWWLHGWD